MAVIARSNSRVLIALVATALTTLVIVGCGTRDASAEIPADPFPALMGTWTVDMDATMDQARANPDLDPAELEQMPSVIEKVMQTMSIQMTPQAMVTRRGQREGRMAYKVKSTGEGQVVVSMEAKGEAVTCTFELLPGDRMRFQSSATDDMNHYVWKRQPID